MKQIKVCIKTMAPIILTAKNNTTIMTATNDYFSGTVVRGVITNEYIRVNNLGKSAHENSDFIELFFDKLRFTDANLVDDITGRRSFMLPMSLQKNKEGTDIIDLINPESEFPGAGYKSMKSFGVLTEDNKIKLVDVKKNISLHMSRSNISEDSTSERLAGRSINGTIYNYESINQNQNFMGYILGEEEYLKKLIDKIDSSWTFFAGRSSSTQYGKCIINFGKIEDIPEDGKFDVKEEEYEGDLYLRLDSNMLNSSGIFNNAEKVLSQLISRLSEVNCGSYSIVTDNGRFFTGITDVDGFVNIWGMKRPREEALIAGSIFALHKNGKWTKTEIDYLNNVMYEGVGIRCEEGFGQLRPWKIKNNLMLWNEKAIKNDIGKQECRITNKDVIKKATDIVKLRIFEMVRMIAVNDAENSIEKGAIPKGSAQFLQRFDSMLVNRKEASWQNISNQLTGSIGESAQKAFNERFNNIRIYCDDAERPRGYSLKEIFKDNSTMKYPYLERLKSEIKHSEIDKAMEYLSISDDIFENSEVFYEYWHWYFRHCRKQVSGKNGD